MSVEAIVAAIETEATAEAERLLAEADAEAARRIADAESTARARLAAAVAAAEPAIRGAEARVLNAARVRLASRRTARLAARTEAAFALAESRLSAMAGGAAPSERWRAALRGLVAETAGLVGAGGELRVRPVDATALADLAERLRREEITVREDPAMAAGVVGRSADGRLVVDATLPVRMARARAALVAAVAGRLRDASPATAGAASPGPAAAPAATHEPAGAGVGDGR